MADKWVVKAEFRDEEVQNLFRRLFARQADMRPVMAEIGQVIRSSVIKNFQESGRPEKWTPTKILSVYLGYTMRRGKRKGRKAYTLKGGLTKGFERYSEGKKTLIDTARLQNSIHPRAYKDRAVVGTNVVYAAIHQFGGKAGRGKKVTIPARPFLMVQEEDWAMIKHVIGTYLVGGG